MEQVLITGATTGIGRAMALTLHARGMAVIALGRRAEALADLAAQAPGITTICCDVTDRTGLAAALSERPVDVLVNNAGVMPAPGPFDRMDAADIDRTVAVNLSAVLWLTRFLLPGMRARGRGHIVFTGSSAAHAPGPNFAAYAAAKAGLSAFAAAIRAEVAAEGLRVTELVPGRVETGLYADVLDPDTRAAMYAGGLSLQPQDVADALVAALTLPARATVTRIDIMPTRPVPPIRI